MTAQIKLRVWLGADPGASGAIALVNWLSSFALTFPLRNLDHEDIYDRVRRIAGEYDVQYGLVELVRALPADMRGPIATAKLLRNYGHLEMALKASNIPFEAHDPQWWQRRAGCRNRGGDKRSSLWRARELFPWLKVTHQVADALLLAYVCQAIAPAPLLMARQEYIKQTGITPKRIMR